MPVSSSPSTDSEGAVKQMRRRIAPNINISVSSHYYFILYSFCVYTRYAEYHSSYSQ